LSAGLGAPTGYESTSEQQIFPLLELLIGDGREMNRLCGRTLGLQAHLKTRFGKAPQLVGSHADFNHSLSIGLEIVVVTLERVEQFLAAGVGH
jgi:hypothetical protein